MKISESVVIVIAAIVLISFGILMGVSAIGSALLNVSWTDILGSIGSVLAGVGTLSGVFVALIVGRQWKAQQKVNHHVEYYARIVQFKSQVFDLVKV